MAATYEGAGAATSTLRTIPLRRRDEPASSSRMTRTCPERPRPGSDPCHVRTGHGRCQALNRHAPDQGQRGPGAIGRSGSPRAPSRGTAHPARHGTPALRAGHETTPNGVPAVSDARGRRAVHPPGRPHHRHQPLTRRRGHVGEPWVPPRVLLYRSAESTSSRAARRAGSTAARMPAATATRVKARASPPGARTRRSPWWVRRHRDRLVLRDDRLRPEGRRRRYPRGVPSRACTASSGWRGLMRSTCSPSRSRSRPSSRSGARRCRGRRRR